ncbi:probable nucleoredoxin 2 [Neltuma alba]|uniref:probable nucleoredoxin 2 n=1 Tax=Neltuma alba TaxID=207710 RepID=UPI0010A2C3C1|nr:probable nucleoredoxin 2 [Prosopis alba]XP_028784616.1 probable nucleoredoxin 2 [Prosopis alba]XP_028787700.1 probable nucleoredoxin 2 [Prosopis alba]XP_028787701.1 probable nucleoredoxin 2 [Prosopis alba]
MRTETTRDGPGALLSNGHMGNLSSSRFSSLLASKDRDFLLSPTGSQVKVCDIEGKVVGLLFGANWYAPCRRFTEVLVCIYEELRSKVPGFEIVYVSSDEDLSAFETYYAQMPWLAIPFSDLETKKALTKKFDVEGIPRLVILLPNGCNKDEATVDDGVELIYRYGVEAYPFSKERLEQLKREDREKHENQTLINLLTNHNRDYVLGPPQADIKQVPVASLVGKTIGLYFSAQWCQPCLNFTPKLISVYHKIRRTVSEAGNGEDFEIVLVSSDRDQACFDSYFSGMPWLALPFGDPEIKRLVRHFDVQGIPTLVILGPDGKTITRNGRNLINLYQENAYPFTDSRVELLEKQLEEEAKDYPRLVCHEGHHHHLNLVSDGNGGGPFICCECEEQGSSWAYQCLECGYEVHPKCVRAPSS